MSGDESQSGQPPSRRLKLVLKTSPAPGEVQTDSRVTPKDGSSSPPRPSYSPVTPTLSHENRPGQDKSEPNLMDEPAALPINMDDNADVIALKATISLLQMQRQQSLKDIRDLDKIKDAALEDPRGFVDDLRAGKLKKSTAGGITFDDVECEDDEESTDHHAAASRFGRLPNAQNIARCPPIEWSKYHIVGKPLDDMHEIQKQYPGATESDLVSGGVRKEHEIAAPYRPFKDKLNDKKS